MLWECRSGGLLAVTSLAILTLRPGLAEEAARAVLDAAVAVGYPREPLGGPSFSGWYSFSLYVQGCCRC